MTVLNPLRGVDARIMDDADMAGPIIFLFCFGICLLLVSAFRRGSANLVLTVVVSLASQISGISMASDFLGVCRCTLC
jgi:hypothetical protein